MRDRPTPSETMVRAVIEQIDGWKSATFGWQGNDDPAIAERNKIAAIEAHAAECLRRIRIVLAADGVPVAQPRDCSTCVHEATHALTYPCRSCKDNALWEPARAPGVKGPEHG